MKVIDLLNKIANGEEVPRKIKWDEYIFEYDKNEKMYYNDDFENICEYVFLNDEIEIIEEPQEHKIPEKLSFILHDDDIVEIPSNEMLMNKINEILKYLEEKEE